MTPQIVADSEPITATAATAGYVPLTTSSSREDVGRAIVREALSRDYSSHETVAALATAMRSDLDPNASNGNNVGIFQLDSEIYGAHDPDGNLVGFFDMLGEYRASPDARGMDPYEVIFWMQHAEYEAPQDALRDGPGGELQALRDHDDDARRLIHQLGLAEDVGIGPAPVAEESAAEGSGEQSGEEATGAPPASPARRWTVSLYLPRGARGKVRDLIPKVGAAFNKALAEVRYNNPGPPGQRGSPPGVTDPRSETEAMTQYREARQEVEATRRRLNNDRRRVDAITRGVPPIEENARSWLVHESDTLNGYLRAYASAIDPGVPGYQVSGQSRAELDAWILDWLFWALSCIRDILMATANDLLALAGQVNGVTAGTAQYGSQAPPPNGQNGPPARYGQQPPDGRSANGYPYGYNPQYGQPPPPSGPPLEKKPSLVEQLASQVPTMLMAWMLLEQQQAALEALRPPEYPPGYPYPPPEQPSLAETLAQTLAYSGTSMLQTLLPLAVMAPMMAANQQRESEPAADEPVRADAPPPPPEGRAEQPPPGAPAGAQTPGAETVNLGGTPVTASPEVNKALQAAYSGPTPDAVRAYADTRGAESRERPWQPVDPAKVQTGDVVQWDNRAALVVAGPDGLKMVSSGELLPLPDPHKPPGDEHGGHGAFQGFKHPSGLDQPADTGPARVGAPPPPQPATV